MRLSLRRNVLWQVLQTGGTSGTELVVLMVLAGYLGATDFGAVAVTLSACKIGFMLVEPRIHEFLSPKLARYAERHPRSAAHWSAFSVRVELCCNAAGLVVCMAGGALASALGIAGGNHLLTAACAVYMGSNTLLKFSSIAIYRCIGRTDLAAWHAMAGSVAKLATLAVAMTLHAGAVAVLLALTLPSLAVAVSQAWIARLRLLRYLGGRGQDTKPGPLRVANQRRQLRLLLANYGTGFAEVGHRELDVQILAFTSGGLVAGGYRLAKLMAMLMLEVLNPLVLVLLPEFSRRLAERPPLDVEAFVRRVKKILVAAASVAAAGVLLGVAGYFRWLAPDQAGNWPVIAILVGGFLLMAPTLWAQAFLVARDRPHVYLRGSLVGGAVAAAAGFLLSTAWGAVGSALGHVGGLLLTNGFAYLQAMREVAGLQRRRAELIGR
jgi:O-antigen/teichoic acid export membrane protein